MQDEPLTFPVAHLTRQADAASILVLFCHPCLLHLLRLFPAILARYLMRLRLSSEDGDQKAITVPGASAVSHGVLPIL